MTTATTRPYLVDGQITELTVAQWERQALETLNTGILKDHVTFLFAAIGDESLYDVCNHGGDWFVANKIAPNGKACKVVLRWSKGSLDFNDYGFGSWDFVCVDDSGKEQVIPNSQIAKVCGMLTD